jgi:hypothetical protein
VLLKEFGHGSHGLDLAKVETHLREDVLLLLGLLEEVVQVHLGVLGKGLIGKPIRFVVAVPPLHLFDGLGLSSGHVAFDLVNVADNLVCNLPITCKLVAVRGPSGGGGRKPLD